MLEQQTITLHSNGRAIIDITAEIESLLHTASIDQGLCHVFLHHTSASLIITENADSDVLRDLENYIGRLVSDGDPAYFHDQEGPDDMAAHIRSVLTQSEVTIPVQRGRLMLGTWQGLFLWEHRMQAHHRKLTVTISGKSQGL